MQTYDVTDLVTEGANALGARARRRLVPRPGRHAARLRPVGRPHRLLAQLHVEHPDGSTTVVGTGHGWTRTGSHVLAADLIEGQHEDRRLVVAGWDRPGFDDAGWEPPRSASRARRSLVPSPRRRCAPVEELRPVSVTDARPGSQVFDLGQNINGWVRLTDLGPAGTELTLTHGEALGAGRRRDHRAPEAGRRPVHARAS